MTEETVTLVMSGQISFQDEISLSQAGEIIAYFGQAAADRRCPWKWKRSRCHTTGQSLQE